LPKDCVSEIEVMMGDKEQNDIISIMSYDAPYMLRKISRRLDEIKHQTSLTSHSSLFSSTDSEEDDGIADLSATTHYCYNNGGSAGHSSQSDSSSQHTSCSSAIPLSTDT